MASEQHSLGVGLFRKDWDRHVLHADQLSRTPGFRALRDQILDRAKPLSTDRAIDIGTGTGLLALALSERVASVWAIDNSIAMVEHLRTLVKERALADVHPLVASAESLPLEVESVDLVVSNYCFHHLGRAGKRRSLEEIYRVLAPGGRLVFADMMFGMHPTSRRDRSVIASKAAAMIRRGPAGLLRLARNALRLLTLTGEHPAPAGWWREALTEAGFIEVTVKTLAHEGGIASAKKPG
ncbi:MAG: methyltransferase domain-containing protein [Solirubrobacterales bacterium]